MSDKNSVMMVGTMPGNGGGIASVVNSYLESGIADRLGIDYYPTHRTDAGKLGKLGFYLRGLVKIARCICNYSIVHIHTASFWSFRRLFLVMLLARIKGKKLIIHLHGGQFREYRKKALPPERWCVDWALSGADRIIVLAEYLKILVAESYKRPESCLVIPNGIRLPDSHKLISGERNGEQTILFLGEVIKRKGLFDLVKAVVTMKTNTTFRVVVAGKGDIDMVSKYAEELGVRDRFVFPGWVGGEEKEQLLINASVYVLPSHVEAMPVSILEAMAYRIPVVATKVGAIPEMLENGAVGILVNPYNSDSLANALDRLLNDEKQRMDLAAAGYKRVKKFYSLATVENSISNLYKQLS